MAGLRAYITPPRPRNWLLSLQKLPKELAGDPRFAKHEGMIAQNANDWPRAVRAYRRAFEFEPFNQGVCYRYRFVLQPSWRNRRARSRGPVLQEITSLLTGKCAGPIMARTQTDEGQIAETKDATDTRGVYYEVLEVKTLGIRAPPRALSTPGRPP